MDDLIRNMAATKCMLIGWIKQGPLALCGAKSGYNSARLTQSLAITISSASYQNGF
jgi:hypothetical protein